MKVWIADQVVQYEGSNNLGVHVTEEGAKDLCQTDLAATIAREGYPYAKPGSTLTWGQEPGDDPAIRGTIGAARFDDYYYYVRPVELSGAEGIECEHGIALADLCAAASSRAEVTA